MQAYRRSFIVQMILFVIFFMMGANVIVSYYFGELIPWLNYVVLGLLVSLGVFGLMIYRKKDDRLVVVTPKEINLLKYLLYGYFGVYLAHMLLQGVQTVPQEPLAVGVGLVLMGIALYGLFLHYRILRVK
jgi:predicted membrane channel-forming protein YqfA (hemolysin III family)